MPAIEIKPKVYWIGVNDRTTDLFEGLWPITNEGVSYNSYFIDDEKKVLIDLAKAFKADEFLDQLSQITDVTDIDYIVVNHVEPDHTGVLNIMRRVAPKATIIGCQKTVVLLESYHSIRDQIKVVKDGETISVGERTLQFFETPFVHWPETMMTYETTDNILFSCDAFGGYGALRGAIFDDECTDFDFYQKESLRYYVNIVAKYSNAVLKAIEKLADLPIRIVAPSHGLIWQKNPQLIVDLYSKWAGYASGQTELGVTLIYGSMYGNTETLMNAVAQGISGAGLPVDIFDAARTHVSYILPSLWTKRGVMIGTPTYETKLFPPVANVLNIAVQKRIMSKKAAIFGSYGWSKGAERHFEEIVTPLKWDISDCLQFAGRPTPEDITQGEAFGAKFANDIKNA